LEIIDIKLSKTQFQCKILNPANLKPWILTSTDVSQGQKLE